MKTLGIDTAAVKIGFAAALLASAIAWFVLDCFPASGDEHAYLLQGQFFSEGALSGAGFPAGVRDLFEVDHVLNGERVRAKYPPGWPALLAVGHALGAPFIVLPLIVLLCCFCTAKIAGKLELSPTWATASLCTSPFFLLNAASFHSHAPALAALLLSTLLVLEERPRAVYFSGFVWGVGFLIRPFDAAIFALCVPLLLPRDQWLRWLAPAAFGPLAFGVYNQVQFGSWLTTGYEAYRPTFALLYPEEGALGEPALSNLRFVGPHLSWIADLWRWTPWLIVAGALGLVATFKTPKPRLHRVARWGAVYGALSLVSIFFLKQTDGDSYGPRYLFPLLLPLSIFAGGVPLAIGQLERRVRLTLVGVLGLATTYALLAQVGSGYVDIRQKSAIFRVIESSASESKRIVVIGEGNPRAAHFFTRNLSPESPTLLVRNKGPDSFKRLRAEYPQRLLFQFIRTGEFSGRLVQITAKNTSVSPFSRP